MAETVHFFLPGVVETPVGGYKEVYEYANGLVQRGVGVKIWHSRAFYAECSPRPTRTLMKSHVRALQLGRRTRDRIVPWFDLDPRVDLAVTGGFPPVQFRGDDTLVATAVETTPFVARAARASGALSVALIQNLETWAAPVETIRAAWAAVDVRVAISEWLVEEARAAGLDAVLVANAVHEDAFPLGPLISTDIGGVRASLGDDALFAPVGDADALVGRIREVLSSRQDAQTRVARARSRFVGRSLDHAVEEFA